MFIDAERNECAFRQESDVYRRQVETSLPSVRRAMSIDAKGNEFALRPEGYASLLRLDI